MQINLPRWWTVALAGVALAAAEWLRAPGVAAAAATVGAALAAALLLRPVTGWARRALLAALAALGAVVVVAQRDLDRIADHWPEEREARVAAAGRRLGGDLHAAFRRAEAVADAAARAGALERPAAFRALAQALDADGPETGVAILEADGTPWAWAGPHRLAPGADGDSIAAASSQFYVTLESRRHLSRGRVAVASVLVWAHAAVPQRDRSLAELFRARTDVALAVFPAGRAPDSPDVFDYVEPTTEGPRYLFSAMPLPPEQGAAREQALGRGGRAVALLLGLVLTLALLVQEVPSGRAATLLLGGWLLLRAPVGDLLGAGALFSPGTYFLTALGPVSASAGNLGVAGILATMAGVWLWRLRLPRRWYGVLPALALLVVAPYVMGYLRRGITPPAAGVPIGLWLTWQVALLAVGAALIVVAAALLRGDRPAEGGGARLAAAVGIAVAASVAGLYLWEPRHGWPAWYPFVWTPALVLVALPARRHQAVAALAIVAGSLAALVTWSAELRGRMEVAQREVARLGGEPDPLVVRLLELFGEEARGSAPPRTASDLYALWRTSVLADRGYPAELALWTPTDGWIATLPLDSLEVSGPRLDSLARAAGGRDTIVTVPALPGAHHVLLTRLEGDTTLVTLVGPATQLVPPSRLGRLLEPHGAAAPPFRLAISPPLAAADAPLAQGWRREGWVLADERPLAVAGTTRVVSSQIDLRGPLPLVTRGLVATLLDVLVLVAVWLVAEFGAGATVAAPRWRALARSFRARLALTLGVFFLLPVAGFTAWGLLRVADDARHAGDVLIGQNLRDALRLAPDVADAALDSLPAALDALGERVDGNLAVYSGGRLVATSAPLLSDLAVLGPFMSPDAFGAMAFNRRLELTTDGPMPALAERVGYRVLQPGAPARLAVLATARRAADPAAATQERDLAIVLVLALLLGVVAAIEGAFWAARVLVQPVAELRRAALALGAGRTAPLREREVPAEFEPVFGAFEKMEADIRASRDALEAARRRTETVLATVAAGVVALDAEGRVLLANRRATELLGIELAPGMPFAARLPDAWGPLGRALERTLAGAPATEAAGEYTRDGRRVNVQAAGLGPDLGGVVLALTDVTDLSRAERVLAWGEMARQVAHEIKNPLTPMRLGMQHLRRAWRDRHVDYDRILEQTAERILGEIDRLDTVARAFSRFAAPAAAEQPVDAVDVTAVAREVVHLYALAEEGARVELEGQLPVRGLVRRDELKEVLVNLLENARNAGASRVAVRVTPGRLEVSDDGSGIPAALLPQVFEPHFSTTSSGSGLGLAIVKRLVEGWGGSVELASEVGRGTVVTVRFAAAGG